MIEGGFKKTIALDDSALEIFTKATQSLIGVSYTPLAYSTAVTSGIKYRFFCSATLLSEPHNADFPTYDAYVYICTPVESEPILLDIKRII